MQKLIDQFNATTDDAERYRIAVKVRANLKKHPMSACLVNPSVLASILIIAEGAPSLAI